MLLNNNLVHSSQRQKIYSLIWNIEMNSILQFVDTGTHNMH